MNTRKKSNSSATLFPKPVVDCVFKYLFGRNDSKRLLTLFLNDLCFSFANDPIIDLDILNYNFLTETKKPLTCFVFKEFEENFPLYPIMKEFYFLELEKSSYPADIVYPWHKLLCANSIEDIAPLATNHEGVKIAMENLEEFALTPSSREIYENRLRLYRDKLSREMTIEYNPWQKGSKLGKKKGLKLGKKREQKKNNGKIS